MKNLNTQEIKQVSGGLGVNATENTSVSTSVNAPVGTNDIKGFANVAGSAALNTANAALKTFGTAVNGAVSVINYGLHRIFG